MNEIGGIPRVVHRFENGLWHRRCEADWKAGRFARLIVQARKEFVLGNVGDPGEVNDEVLKANPRDPLLQQETDNP